MPHFNFARQITRLIVIFSAGLLASCSEAPPEVRSFDDLTHTRMGVMTGSATEAAARLVFPEANFLVFDDIMDAIGALDSGQVDTVTTSETTVIHLLKRNKTLIALDGYVAEEPTAIGLRLEDTELRAKINHILAQLREDGTLQDMKNRWFKEDQGPYQQPHIELPTEGEPFIVGVAATREPMSFVDSEGRISGHDGELARRVAAGLGRPLVFFDSIWSSLLPALKGGRINAIITGMSATEERKLFVGFSDPYWTNRYVVLARKPTTEETGLGLASEQDLEGRRIALLYGSSQDFYFTANYPDSTILRLNSSVDVAQALLADRADVGVLDQHQGVMAAQTSIGKVGQPILPLPVATAFSQSSDALRKQFNAFLAEITADGTLADMKQRWLSGAETEMPDIRRGDPANGTLAVGIYAFGLPFIALRDGEFAGFEVELSERFALYLNQDIQLDNIDVSGLTASVVSGKSDMIAGSLFVTEERKKSVAFSDSYYQSTSTIFALKKNIKRLAQPEETETETVSLYNQLEDSFQINILAEKRYLLLASGLWTTVIISLWSTLLGTLLGGVICAMRMSHQMTLQVLAKLFIAIMRGTPVLVFLMILFYVVFSSSSISPVTVAVLAFAMQFAAYVSEIFRSSIESVHPGQQEAGISLGFTKVRAFVSVVLPQALQRVLPVYKGEFLSMVKMTSIVGYIAVQDLTKAGDLIRSRTYDAFFPLIMIAILYFIVSWLLIQLLDYLERSTDPKRRRRKGAKS
jgi:polar amino acid transport system substrate-binding protein